MIHPPNKKLQRIPPSPLSPRTSISYDEQQRPIIHNNKLFKRRSTQAPLRESVSFARRAALINDSTHHGSDLLGKLNLHLFDKHGRLNPERNKKSILAKSPDIKAQQATAKPSRKEKVLRATKKPRRKKKKRQQATAKLLCKKNAPTLFTLGDNLVHPNSSMDKPLGPQWLSMGGRKQTAKLWREELSKPTLPTDWDLMKGIPWIAVKVSRDINKPLFDKVLQLKLYSKNWGPLLANVQRKKAHGLCKLDLQDKMAESKTVDKAELGRHESNPTHSKPCSSVPTPHNSMDLPAIKDDSRQSSSIISPLQQEINNVLLSRQPVSSGSRKRKGHHKQTLQEEVPDFTKTSLPTNRKMALMRKRLSSTQSSVQLEATRIARRVLGTVSEEPTTRDPTRSSKKRKLDGKGMSTSVSTSVILSELLLLTDTLPSAKEPSTTAVDIQAMSSSSAKATARAFELGMSKRDPLARAQHPRRHLVPEDTWIKEVNQDWNFWKRVF